jgi:ABC-type transport system involved in multi-copper enzyme maturation permease subunit
MSASLALAWNTVLEAVREKVLYLLGGFAVFVFVASRILSPLALGEGRRVTMDLGMLALSFFGLLIIIFVGHSLVYREIERGSVAFVFSRPVGRGAFVAGKFTGLALVLTIAEAAMGAILAVVLLLSRYPFGGELAGAIFLGLLELWVLAAVAILFASLASPVLAGLFVLGAWVIGNTAGGLADLASLLPSPVAAGAIKIVLWFVPRLDLFNGTAWLAHGAAVSPERWAFLLAYTGLYVVGALLLARAAFSRRALLG